MNTNKFLEFNGKTIYFHAVDGEFWIAIKPICEVLNVHYNRQLLTLKSDDFFEAVYSLQDIQVQSESGIWQSRKMVCLPERYVYGWILSLQSQSPELKEYKKVCYDILYNYFHGTITGRKELLKKKVELDIEIAKTQNNLLESEDYKKLQELKKKQTEVTKGLNNNDKKAIQEAITLFNYDNN